MPIWEQCRVACRHRQGQGQERQGGPDHQSKRGEGLGVATVVAVVVIDVDERSPEWEALSGLSVVTVGACG
jgi:hypothetical protein